MDIADIEEKIRKMVTKYQALEETHQELRQQLDVLQQACKRLQSKRDLAIHSVEKIINQLKLVEKQS